MGDVVDDIAAMASADVAIGVQKMKMVLFLRQFATLFLAWTFCDFSDFCFEPSICPANRFNMNLIVGSSIVLAAASFAAAFSHCKRYSCSMRLQ